MDDMRYMNRENRKKQLRDNIVELPRREEQEDSEEIVRRAEHRTRRRHLLRFLFLALIIGGLAFGFYRYQTSYSFSDYQVSWEKSMRYSEASAQEAGAGEGETEGEDGTAAAISENGFVKYVYFGENMLKYTRDGASYINASGKSIWTESYEMKSPIVSINGDYVAIADQQGTQIYICSTEGKTGVASTKHPITKVAVSGKGVTAAVVEDGNASYVNYFRKDGSELAIEVKLLLSGDGYPVDIALSPDGLQIVMAISYLDNGVLKSKVAFYDFSEIGKNVENRFIGGFEDEFSGAMIGRVRYLNANTVAVFSNLGVSLISVKNVIPDTNIISIPVEETIESICYSEKYVGLVVDSAEGGANRMDIYAADGKKVAAIPFDYDYTGVQIDGEQVILYNEESCMICTVRGHKKFEGALDMAVSNIRPAKGKLNSFLVAGREKMQEIRLK